VENEVANCKPLFVFVCLSSWLSLVSLCLCIFSSLCLFACLRNLLALSLSACTLVVLPVCRLFVCRPSLPLFLCIFVSICMAAVFRLFLCISVHLSVCLYVSVSFRVFMSVCPSVRGPVIQLVRLSVCPPFCVSGKTFDQTNGQTDKWTGRETERKMTDRYFRRGLSRR